MHGRPDQGPAVSHRAYILLRTCRLRTGSVHTAIVYEYIYSHAYIYIHMLLEYTCASIYLYLYVHMYTRTAIYTHYT